MSYSKLFICDTHRENDTLPQSQEYFELYILDKI